MKKCIYILSTLLLIMMTFSCRKSFNADFPNVLIINQPPTILPLDTLFLNSGFGDFDVDLSNSVSDPENDPLSITAVSEDTGVVTVAAQGLILTLTEVGNGTSSIHFTINDGTIRDTPVTATLVVVVIKNVLQYQFNLSFIGIPNGTIIGTLTEPYTFPDGTQIQTVEGSDGSSRTVNNGVMDWTTDEYDVMSMTFAQPLDLTTDATVHIEYADLWSSGGEMIIYDANGNQASLNPFNDMVLNDPNFNTYEFDLKDFTGTDVDLSAVTEITWEKNGAADFPNPQTFKLRFFGVGKL